MLPAASRLNALLQTRHVVCCDILRVGQCSFAAQAAWRQWHAAKTGWAAEAHGARKLLLVSTSAGSMAAVVLSALSRQAMFSKCKELHKHVALAEDLLNAQVCTRCLLRVLRHNKWEDYALEQPDSYQLIQELRKAAAAKEGGQLPQDRGDDQREAHTSRPATTAGETVDAVSSAINGMTRDTLTAAEAPPQKAASPCTVCLGLLERIASKRPAQEPVAHAAAGPYSNRALPVLSPDALCQVLTGAGADFTTFALDVNVPLSVLLRERILAEYLCGKYGWMGVFKPNADVLLPLKHVVRRVVGPLIVQHLAADKKQLDGGTDLTLVLSLEHPEAMSELRPLIEDHVRFQMGKREAKAQPGMSNRQRKKLRYQEMKAEEAAVAAASSAAPTGAGDADVEDVAMAEREVTADGRDAAGASEEAALLGEAGPSGLQDSVDAMMATITHEKALAQVQNVPARVFRRLFPWPLKPLAAAHVQSCVVNVRLTRASVFLAGRYLKLQRGMPQSRWFDPQTGQRIGHVSLAERIEEAVLPVYRADESKFIAGGREDADVRMMGEGRPFVLELINPQRTTPSTDELANVERTLAQADHGARAVQLVPCCKKAMDKIKEAEESKEKTYSALCWAERPLTEEDVELLLAAKDLTVMQDTPLRVLHRRAPKVRSKKVSVEAVHLVAEKPAYFSVQLRTQAGAYVKEFCHGDLGRTHPNLGTLLGCRTEILQLDVVAVHMPDWP